MTKSKGMRNNRLNDKINKYRAGLEALVTAHAFPDDDHRKHAAVNQALEEATILLGGEAWDDWGPWNECSTDGLGGIDGVKPVKCYVNNRFEVWVYVTSFVGDVEGKQAPMAHLSIKRRDKLGIDFNHWRILQRIKDEIIGEECEGIELFPREDRLMDSANQYHIWCLPPGHIWPVGYPDRVVASETTLGGDWDDDDNDGASMQGFARQRPLHPDDRPPEDPSNASAEDRERFANVGKILRAKLLEDGNNPVDIEGIEGLSDLLKGCKPVPTPEGLEIK